MKELLQITVFSMFLLFLIGTSGCSKPTLSEGEPFTYQNIPITKESAKSGEGEIIQFRDNSLVLSGQKLQAGQSLRSVKLTKTDLTQIDLVDTKGRIRIISIVPSLDTKVCEQQTHYLSENNKGLDQNVLLITISIDTPFAQDRFAKEAHIKNVMFLSDYRGGEFGEAHGLLLESPHLLTRAIMVVDKHNIVRFLQISPNLGHLPDMEAAFQEARALVTSAQNHPLGFSSKKS